MKTLEALRKELSPSRRRKIKIRTSELLAEEMTRQELRRACKLTQVRLASLKHSF